MANGDVTFGFRMPREELEKSISDAVRRELDTRIQQVIDDIRDSAADKQRTMHKELEGLFATSLADKQAIEAIRESAVQKQASVTKDLDSLFTQVATAKRDVENQLDAIRERITRKANSYLIPTATLILLGGILGLWAVVGSMAVQLRTSVNTTLEDTRRLQDNIAGANTNLTKVQQDLLEAQHLVSANQNSIEQLKTANPLAAQVKDLNQLKADYKAVVKRLDVAEAWINKQKPR